MPTKSRLALEAAVNNEREKWLPLWEAVKEFEKEDNFAGDNWCECYERETTVLARRDIYLALVNLRSQGEK
jgi:hypothetical protein